jgi:Cytochrome c oxidase subunit Va
LILGNKYTGTRDADSYSDVGIKAKVENKGQYEQYLEELKPLREELGVNLKEDLYPEGNK